MGAAGAPAPAPTPAVLVPLLLVPPYPEGPAGAHVGPLVLLPD